MSRISQRAWDALCSLKLTIACLAVLMVLVVACTLAQINLGTLGAVDAYIRSFLVWWDVPGTLYSVPVFPGGGLVGLVLVANLLASQIKRMELSARKAGLWVIHAGLIVLFAGEFVTSAYQVEMQLAIEEGQTLAYVESPREVDLVVTDTTARDRDEVYGIPEALLARAEPIEVPGTPLTLSVKSLSHDTGTAQVEPLAAGRRYGTRLVSSGGAPQTFTHEGRTYSLSMQPRRQYLPYSLTLKKFSHDVYPGTDIPKNFSSLIHISNPARGEERDVLIYMNQPLRYDGKAFYQASFGKGDTLSILQVVENPGWLLPYLSCVLVAAGLLLHFALSLVRSLRRRHAALVEA
jgi:hypothetical protein